MSKPAKHIHVLVDEKTEEQLRLDAAKNRKKKPSVAGRAFFRALLKNDRRALEIIEAYQDKK